jgi:hypothetical protein
MQIDEYPKEFFEDEQWEWSQIFKAKGQDVAIAFIKNLRN